MSETLIERASRLGLADVNISGMCDRVEELEQQLKNAEYAKKIVSDHRNDLERQNAELRQQLAASADKTAATMQPVCRTCGGSGIDGDCGSDGAPVDVQCGCCNGTGKAAQQPQAAQSEVRGAMPLKKIEANLVAASDSAYCAYIHQLQQTECLGWEQKVRSGNFGKSELDAHSKAGEWLGNHRAFLLALRIIKDALAQAGKEQSK